jgi:hypothetical protein
VFEHTDVAVMLVASACSIDSSIDKCVLCSHSLNSNTAVHCKVLTCTESSLTLSLMCNLLCLLTLTARGTTSTNSSSGGINSTAAAAAAAGSSAHGYAVKSNTAQEPDLQHITMCARCVQCHTH